MRKFTGLLFALLFIGAVSCDNIFDDQPAAPEEEIDPPELPSLDQFEYDFGALGEVEPVDNFPAPAYDELEDPVALIQSVLGFMLYENANEIIPAIQNVLEPVDPQDGEFDLDAFAWQYPLNTQFYQGVEINTPDDDDAVLRARVRDDGSVDWELQLFGDITQDGEYTLLEGSNSQDASEIDWTLYDFEADPIEIEAAESQWTLIDNFVSSASLRKGFDPDAPLPELNISFNIEGSEATVLLTNVISDSETQNFTAEYDYDEGDGWINYRMGEDEDSVREYCWDTDHELIDCEEEQG